MNYELLKLHARKAIFFVKKYSHREVGAYLSSILHLLGETGEGPRAFISSA
jgi:hypothetical protein